MFEALRDRGNGDEQSHMAKPAASGFLVLPFVCLPETALATGCHGRNRRKPEDAAQAATLHLRTAPLPLKCF